MINMIQLQLIDFFSIFSMFLSLFSNVTAVETAATTTSAQRPVFEIAKVPRMNSYIWNFLKAPASTLELGVLNIVVAY